MTTSTTSITTGLYEAWTTAARDIRRRYSSASISQVHAAQAQARAWEDGAAHVHIVDDIGAYLTEQIQREDTAADARQTYAAMLNDLRTAEAAAAENGDDRDLVAYAADVVIWRRTETGHTEVLLIQRRWAPHVGAWALPGGHVDAGETAAEAAVREAAEETGVLIDAAGLQWVGLYDAPGRDPRGRVVSAAYAVEVDHTARAVAGDDAAEAEWVPLAEAFGADLAFDHGHILRRAMALPAPA